MPKAQQLLDAAIKKALSTVKNEIDGDNGESIPEIPHTDDGQNPGHYRKGVRTYINNPDTGEAERVGGVTKLFFINRLVELVEQDDTIKNNSAAKQLLAQGKTDYDTYIAALYDEDDHHKPKPLTGALKEAIEGIDEAYDAATGMKVKSSAIIGPKGKFEPVGPSGRKRRPSVPEPDDEIIQKPKERAVPSVDLHPKSKSPVWLTGEIEFYEEDLLPKPAPKLPDGNDIPSRYKDTPWIDKKSAVWPFKRNTNDEPSPDGKVAGDHGAAPANPALEGSKLNPESLPKNFDIFNDQDKKLPIPNIADDPRKSPKRR